MAFSSRGHGRQRGRGFAVGMRPVAEADRITIMDRLQQFRESSSQELTFEADLSNHDRAVVHSFCQKMGFKSKSYGKGSDRRVTVFKNVNRKEANATVTPIFFCRETKEVLVEIFSQFPPSDEEGNVAINAPADVDPVLSSAAPEKVTALFLTPAEIANNVSLLSKKRQTTLKKLTETTQKLPIWKFRDVITTTVDQNKVVIIAGETGCGKSTQVPQYLLDHMWGQGKSCRVVCTQPRRISATSVADRIATERGEAIGETVGYQIRLESRGGPHSSLMFCTNGVLLRKLVTAKEAGVSATHIIVDEIHERDCNADFLLIVLKGLLLAQPDLRLVLMSATLDAELFSSYFNNCPVLKIPGFTHPVTVYYLEDVLSMTNFEANARKRSAEPAADSLLLSEEDADEMDNALTCAWLDDDFEQLLSLVTENPRPEVVDYQHSSTGITALMVAAGKGRVEDVGVLLSLGSSCSLVSQEGQTALDMAESNGEEEAAETIREHIKQAAEVQTAEKEAEILGKYHGSVDQEEVDILLIERLLHTICSDPGDGAVLVFLPGWEDITRCRDQLMASPFYSDETRFLILPLHSMIPMSDQKKIFTKPPPGARKIVLATNIAESAITIDDVVYVIDSGRMKEKSYDPYTNVSTFQTTWVSKASARQRQGRAGRCRAGFCYHLFSKVRAASLADFQLPEMKRTPLEEVCLKVKLLQPRGDVRDFLSSALDPPLDISIQNAMSLLQDIGALTPAGELSELGQQLGSLPVHPATSKMLLLSILLNCLDPALTIACAAGYRDPFVLPMAPHLKREAFAAKNHLASKYGGYSDHLAVVAAFDGWEAARKRGQDYSFCSQYSLSPGVMNMLDGMRKQLLRELTLKGFVKRDPRPCSLNAKDPGIVRAILSACLYPSVARILPPDESGRKVIAQIARGEKVRIHPQSSNFRLLVQQQFPDLNVYNDHLLVFDEVTRGESQVYIRNNTCVKPHPLLFFCTELSVAPLRSYREEEYEMAGPAERELMEAADDTLAMVIDRWLKYQTSSVMAAQVYCLRERLLSALLFKVKNPSANLPDMLAASVHALACVFSYEGALSIDDYRTPPPRGYVTQQQEQRRPHQHERRSSRQENSSFERFYRAKTKYVPVVRPRN
ncbi:DExH-box ATP-dependent RNA helicase DExH6 [Selaginella moellendorffii]|uniref:DExH-box ATP-dependent RNA helicase DExH6 n=1 Tax=Selaginella moellendorffii TaxID=88036 RepID=UPI000D1CEB4B|nr:DExH-box ATP-dependent RNA helicase DExH6 [Selaginella moellendorffii]XP_024539367.1 DExH-box ATP-dependent RNA helicase DExH6 [Selaginella moellendorffii]|eukprot:XP_002978696.2 DExH-box ATP-dependent RNA helicase DExH6 [Selaginella moellendorffii]